MYRAWLTAHIHTKICRGPKDILEGLGQQRPFQFVVQTYLPVMHLGAVVAAGGHKPILYHTYRFFVIFNIHICTDSHHASTALVGLSLLGIALNLEPAPLLETSPVCVTVRLCKSVKP